MVAAEPDTVVVDEPDTVVVAPDTVGLRMCLVYCEKKNCLENLPGYNCLHSYSLIPVALVAAKIGEEELGNDCN